MTALIIGITLVLLAGGVVVAAAGHGEGLAPREVDDPPIRLPEQGITGHDVREVRFSTAMRGYRVAEVDEVLERLANEIDELRKASRGSGDTEGVVSRPVESGPSSDQ